MVSSNGLDSVQGQLDNILDSDSPLMQRAATQGKQYANQRGLLNSSMAAGASQGAMIDRATPIAQQDAGYHQDLGRMDRSNEHALGQMDRGNEHALGQMDRGNEHALGQMEAGYGYDIGRMEQQQKDALAQMQMGHSFDMDKLQGTSMANAWGVMSNNITDIVAQSMDAINNIQANSDISASDKTKMIKQITDMRDTDIKFQQSLYSNLSKFLSQTGVFPSL